MASYSNGSNVSNAEPMQKSALEVLITMPENILINDESGDDKSLEKAAIRCRLMPNEFSAEERKYFFDVETVNRSNRDIYFFIRNKILQLWIRNARDQLTVEKCLVEIGEPYKTPYTPLIHRIHVFLERYGYINFGIYNFTKFLRKIFRLYYYFTSNRCNKTVIVIGAGMAGLIAARQLESFGFDVTVIEARNRVGGRMALFRKGPYVADLGAMIVAGLGGNPIITLSQQVPMGLQSVKPTCPLYSFTGDPIPRQIDEQIEKEFNKLLESCAYMAHTVDIDKIHNKQFSLGECFEHILTLQENHIKDRQLQHWKHIVQMQQKLSAMYIKLNRMKSEIRSLSQDYTTAHQTEKPQDPEENAKHDFYVRLKRRELENACKTYDSIKNNIDSAEQTLKMQTADQPGDFYMSSRDRRILDWHIANLEFANAAPLDKLSLKHWDQDDENEFGGNHLSVKNGYASLPMALEEGLTIKFKCPVQEIQVSPTGVVVKFVECNGNNAESVPQTLEADAVLCTLPLGVLKYGLLEDETSDPKYKLTFDPPLSQEKLDSIKRLGFGILNKVVLCFDRIFWDPENHMLGYINNESKSRGEFFMFWTIYKEPVILAVIAGEAAEFLETVKDGPIVERCLSVLRTIFKDEHIQPKESIVTRWRSDPWARGSYSYVSVGSTGHDYDVLAKPIGVDESKPENPRLFFAGEHTCPQFPATVHGALISGLREAANIANTFLPQI